MLKKLLMGAAALTILGGVALADTATTTAPSLRGAGFEVLSSFGGVRRSGSKRKVSFWSPAAIVAVMLRRSRLSVSSSSFQPWAFGFAETTNERPLPRSAPISPGRSSA